MSDLASIEQERVMDITLLSSFLQDMGFEPVKPSRKQNRTKDPASYVLFQKGLGRGCWILVDVKYSVIDDTVVSWMKPLRVQAYTEGVPSKSFNWQKRVYRSGSAEQILQRVADTIVTGLAKLRKFCEENP